MSRPSRSERFASNSRNRPKRRAATNNYLFKYQLAGDPNRIEENALKKALQESLEEQKRTPPPPPMTAGAAVIASKQKGKNKFKQSNKTNDPKTNQGTKPPQQQRQQHVRAIINSSTNSSDVSKASNNSTTTTNSSSGICRDTSSTIGKGSAIGNVASSKRLRSSAPTPMTAPTPTKRAKLTINGHSNINSSLSRSLNKNKCDKEDTSVLAEYPVPLFNRSVQKTYSRGQQSKQTNGHSTPERQQGSTISPRTSTPIAGGRQTISDTSTLESSVSKSTQTVIEPVVDRVTNKSTTSKTDLVSLQKATLNNNGKVSEDTTSETIPSIQNHYLKLKRESKNYAYAKMTALKVNTGKSSFSGVARSSSSSSKKGSPSGVLNHNNTNKNSKKHGSKGISKIDDKNPRLDAVGGSERSSSVNNQTPGLSKNYIQANVSVLKKRVAEGSWSLLGVPEEKILYLRDDEPPRRLICYPAIKHVEGDVIQVRDSVLLRSGAKQTDLPYIAKVCAFWQDAETGGVMMSLFWYYRPEHTEDGRKPHHLIDEIFASRHRDVDTVECIEDKCYVLTFNEYCRYRKRCKMEQVGATWSLTDVTIPVSNESYPRRNRIPDSNVNPELVFCCRQIYDSRNRRLIKNPLINPKYGHI